MQKKFIALTKSLASRVMRRAAKTFGLGLTLCCAALCLSAPLRAGEQVPFKGNFDLIILGATPVDATHVRLDVQVNAQATMLGRAQGLGFVILDVTTFGYVGESTLAGANGDAVVFAFVGQFVPSGTPGILENIETFQIVGGTGRFEGATGAGIAGGKLDAVTLLPLTPSPLQGTISSPGSLKK